jgi:hypothetical protein
MFHTVFCRSERTPTGQEVANWVMDAAAFDDLPTFSPPFDELAGAGWGAIEVIYDEAKRPVQILRHQGAACAPHVDEALATLKSRGFFGAQPELVARLRETRLVLLVEFDEMLASDEVWELLDFVEARACRELDGVAYSEDEGFFDGANQPICAFS